MGSRTSSCSSPRLTTSAAARLVRRPVPEERPGFPGALPSVWGVWGAMSGPPTFR